MSDTRIAGIKGRRVWDPPGRPPAGGAVPLKRGAFRRPSAPAGPRGNPASTPVAEGARGIWAPASASARPRSGNSLS